MRDKLSTEVNAESMKEFISEHGMWAKVVEMWIMARAKEGDITALNHFASLVTIDMGEAVRRIRENDFDGDDWFAQITGGASA